MRLLQHDNEDEADDTKMEPLSTNNKNIGMLVQIQYSIIFTTCCSFAICHIGPFIELPRLLPNTEETTYTEPNGTKWNVLAYQ